VWATGQVALRDLWSFECPLRWHGIMGSVGIIGVMAAPGVIGQRWMSAGSEAPRRVDRNGRAGVVFLTANRFELWELGAGG
jgi:hypothetical protein